MFFTAEFSALQRQRSTEVFLHTLTASTNSQNRYSPSAGVISNGYYDTPTLPAVNPLYESVDEVHLKMEIPSNLQMTDCPAYVQLPIPKQNIENQVQNSSNAIQT